MKANFDLLCEYSREYLEKWWLVAKNTYQFAQSLILLGRVKLCVKNSKIIKTLKSQGEITLPASFLDQFSKILTSTNNTRYYYNA